MATSTHILTTPSSETPAEQRDSASTSREASGPTDLTTVGPGGRKRKRKHNGDGKVFHVSNALHARVQEYCAAHDVQIKVWVDRILTAVLNDKTLVPVKKKPLPGFAANTEDEPWSRPPFWAQQPQQKPDDA